MINEIRLKNFKLHESAVIVATPITILIGPNNSGKSSVLQAPLCLRQAAVRNNQNFMEPFRRGDTAYHQPYLYPNGVELIDLGAFNDVLRHGCDETAIGLTGVLDLRKPKRYATSVQVSVDVNVRENRLVYHKGHVLSQSTGFEWQYPPPGTDDPAHQFSIEYKGCRNGFNPGAAFGLISDAKWSHPGNMGQEERVDVQAFLRQLLKAPVRLLKSLHPIFPVRGFEEWGYPLPDEASADAARMVLSDRMMATISILAYNKDLAGRLSDWLDELMGLRLDVRLLPGKRVTIRCIPSGRQRETALTGEGSGAQQLPFILLPIGMAESGESILLSEPEVHLHPKAQSALAELLLRIVEKEPRQLFIETHSEHILHSFLNAVGKGTLEREKLSIYYFENGQECSSIRRLDVNDRGQVEGGLPGFFEHSLSELTDFLSAVSKS